MKLTAEQETLLKGYTAEQREEFDKLSAAEKTARLEMLARFAKPATTGTEMEEAVGATREEYPIISPASLVAGMKIVGRFLGTKFMFSTEEKKNWEVEVIPTAQGNKKIWVNRHYVLEDLESGEKFGVFKSPSLNKVLPKVPTRAAYEFHRGDAPEGLVNPVVELEYVGHIEGVEKLKNEYDLQITNGNSSHVFFVRLPKGFTYDGYATGVVNWINEPTPNFGTSEKLEGQEARERDLRRLRGADAAQAQIAVENGAQAPQINAPAM